MTLGTSSFERAITRIVSSPAIVPMISSQRNLSIAPAAAESLSRLLPPKKGLFAAEYDVTLAFYLVRLAADANLWELSAHFDGRVFSAEITLARSARALPLIAREPDIRGLESAVERRVGILPAKGEK